MEETEEVKNRLFSNAVLNVDLCRHLAVRLDRRPEVDQVRSGVRERHAGFSSTGQSVKDSTFIHALQVAQILTEVEL